jgi:hypothetical protein
MNAFPESGYLTDLKRRRALTARALAVVLRAGEEVADEDFDRLAAGAGRIPGADLKATPLAVATRALRMLTGGEPSRVLDACSGIGKLSIVGALTTTAVFTGVERRLSLVRASRAAALRFGARRTTFIHGNVEHMALGAFDAIYLFDSHDTLSGKGEDGEGGGDSALSRRSASCTLSTWRSLPRARPGIRVVTYRCQVEPPGCHLIRREVAGGGELALFETR